MEISNRIYINNKPVYPVFVTDEKTPENRNYSSVPNLCPEYYTPSFTAMKKSEFAGVESLVIEKYKAPIQSFKTKNDFDTWTDEKCKQILDKDYKGRTEESTVQRKSVLEEWKNYLYIENDAYSPQERLLILDGITKGLKSDTDSIPPVLNKRILADTMDNLKKELKQNPNKKEYNFYKTYQNNLRNFYIPDIEESTGTDMTGWVIIPSKEHDTEHFEENVNKLKTLSHNSWCTKSFNAEPYLRDGDFHIYLENGKPKLGIRFQGNYITEIQGEKNNSRIPFGYYDICTNYIKENRYDLSYGAREEIDTSKKLKTKYAPLMNAFKNGTRDEIFKALDIKEKRDENGNLIISHFCETQDMERDNIFINDFEIEKDKLNELFKNVVKIEGDANFINLNIGSLQDIKEIGGDLDIRNTKNLKSLGKLKKIGGDAELRNSNIEDLGALEEIGENAYCNNTQNLKSLGSLKKIGGDADFSDSNIEDFGALEEIGENAYCNNTQNLKSLGSLKKIGRNAEFFDSNIEDLGALEEIGKDAYFNSTQNLKSLGSLKKIGRDAEFSDSNIEDLGALEEIGKSAYFNSTQNLKSLGSLKKIGRNANFNNSNIENLGDLEIINGNAYFHGTKNLTSLGKLKKIGGNANFCNSNITIFDNLERIDGNITYSFNKPEFLEKLKKKRDEGTLSWGGKIIRS